MPGLISGLAIVVGLLLGACILLLHKQHQAEMHLAQLEQQLQVRPPLHAIQRPPAASTETPVASQLFFQEHNARGAGEQPRRISLVPSRLMEFQLETPVAMRNVERWTVSITYQHNPLLLGRGLRPQQIGGVSFVRVYVDSSIFDPGNYDVLLSSDTVPLSSYSVHWTLVAAK
jgi:hypothetical protein